MKKTITFFTSLIVMIIMGTTVNAQALLIEHFDYPVGDSLTAHGWTAHSGTGPISTVSGNLSYTGYCTPIGQSAGISSAAGQDINHAFTAPSSGSIYAAILINVTNATVTGDYFFHFMTGTTTFVGRLFIKKDATDATKFTAGVLKGSTVASTVYSPTLLSMNTTHLMVLKYTINSGAGDDVVSLFVDPATGAEGTPTVVAADVASTDLSPVGIIALRQGSASVASSLIVDGLRVATNWADVIGFNGVVTAPVITTGSATGITSTTAICGGNVTADGGAVVSARGICYGAAVNPDITGTKVIATGTTGVYTSNLISLTAGTLYHYRAYATNSAGTAYGADSSFTTPIGAVAPVVSTGTAIPATTTASVAGNVSNDGGSAVLARGICWAITANPDTSLTSTHTSETGTTGSFISNLTGLTASTLYHARAYARNAVGISYGNDITFTTQVAGIPCANIAALYAKTADGTTVYELTGEAVLTYKQAYGNQKWIQDASGAIMIYDIVPASGSITNVYNIGDGITGIKGKLAKYYGLLEFLPVANPALATSTGNVVVPTVITAAELSSADTTTMYAHQSKLIKLAGVNFTDANGVLKFGTSKKFRITQGTTTDSLFYCNFFDADYAATATAMVIPSGSGDVIGIVVLTKGNYYITSRSKTDISLLNGINELEANKIGIYPNPSNGKFTVNIEKYNNGEIRVYSLVGSLIMTQTINKASNEFDLSAYGKGMYFVQYSDLKSGKSWTEKLIVK